MITDLLPRAKPCPAFTTSGSLWRMLGLGLLLLCPLAAHAHPGPVESATGHPGSAFWVGFLHPWSGLDHLLAMLAVGLWAAQLGGRARWTVPGCFLSAMLIGGIFGFNTGGWSGLEPLIASSVLLLGLLIAFAVRLPWAIPAALVAVFALFHGVAHGAEWPMQVSATGYAAGFLFATATLHALGLLGGILLLNRAPAPLLRWAGAGLAVVGVFLLGQGWLG